MKLTIAQFTQLWSASDGSTVKFRTAVSEFERNNKLAEEKSKKEEKKND